jgi:hypothetical protein
VDFKSIIWTRESVDIVRLLVCSKCLHFRNHVLSTRSRETQGHAWSSNIQENTVCMYVHAIALINGCDHNGNRSQKRIQNTTQKQFILQLMNLKTH